MYCKEFGWQEISMEEVRGLSNAEMKEMLESIAWRKAREKWGREMGVKPKLIMLKKITNLKWSDCAGLRQRADRKMMTISYLLWWRHLECWQNQQWTSRETSEDASAKPPESTAAENFSCRESRWWIEDADALQSSAQSIPLSLSRSVYPTSPQTVASLSAFV